MVNVFSDECSEILAKAAKNIKMEKQQRSGVSLNQSTFLLRNEFRYKCFPGRF